MPDGYLISVGVKADFSELKTEQRAAQDAVKQATANMEAAYAEFGKAAADGNTQAIAYLKQYEMELSQAQARATAATAAMAASQQAVGAAVSHTVPQYAAASGAIRVLEGNLNNNVRAAERFLATTLGLGPVLQAAFPVVGAIAMVGVLTELGKRVEKFGRDAFELSNELGIGWLDAAIGQVDGLAEAVKQGDDNIDHMRRQVDQLKEKGEQLDIEHIRLTQGPRAALEAQIAEQERTISSLRQASVLDQTDREKTEKLAQQRTVSYDPKSGVRSETVPESAVAAQVHLKELGEDAKKTALEIEEAQKKIRNYNDEIANIKPPKAAVDHSDRDAMKEHGRDVMAMVKENEDAAKEQQRITDEVQAAGIRGLKEEEDERRRADEAERIRLRLSKQNYDQELAAEEKSAEAAYDSANAQIEAAAKVAEARIEYLLASGAITAEEAAHARATIEARKYTDQIKALEYELRALQAIQNKGGDTGEKQDQVRNKITAFTGDRDAALVKGAGKEAQEYTKVWQKALADVGRQFQQNEDAVLRGQISLSMGMRRMAAEVALDGIHWAQRWLQQHFMANAMKLASTNATNAATVASDAAAAETSTTITRTHALQQAFIHAKLAAVKAFDWGTGWGGPIVGAVMAAAAFAGSMAWAAFEQGGVAQVTGPAYLHAGERVLTARQTATFDRVMSMSSISHQSRSANASIHLNHTVNGAGNDREIKKVIRQSSRDVALATKRALRNGHL